MEPHYPAFILEELDRLLKQDLRRDQDEDAIRDGLDGGVLFIPNNSEILYSGAQIPAWIGDANGVKYIKGSRNSIGSDSVNKEKKFTNIKIEYSQGMTLYMATDGLKDQPGGMKKLPFGKGRVTSLLNTVLGLSLEEQSREIRAAYEAYTRDESRRDDVAMIGIRI
jgi:serine phosphatase RsbU (regulator of sigma subunit)